MLSQTRATNALRKDMGTQQAKTQGPTLGEFYSTFQGLPGLRGLWYAGSQDNTGAMYDQSGQGRMLTYAGNPALTILNDLVPWESYDGTGDWHTRPDEAGLDIIGTETYITANLRGLLMCCWMLARNVATQQGVVTKDNGTTDANSSYGIFVLSSGKPFFRVINATATGNTGVSSSVTLVAGAWNFIMASWIPATSVNIWVNGTLTTAATTIASLNNSVTPFQLAAANSGQALDGGIALAALCAARGSQTMQDNLFARTRPLFNV